MPDRFLLESGGADGYLLEDGSGVLLLEDSYGPELNTTPDFSSSTGYALFGSATISGGTGNIPNTTPGSDAIQHTLSVSGVAGKTYRAEFEIKGLATASLVIAAGVAGNYNVDGTTAYTSLGVQYYEWTVSHAGSPLLSFLHSSGGAGTAVIDNLSIREKFAVVGGKIKVWDGGAWAEKPIKVWDGGAWVEKPLKVWDGGAWVLS